MKEKILECLRHAYIQGATEKDYKPEVCAEEIIAEFADVIERTNVKVYDKQINPDVIDFYIGAVAETKRVIIEELNK